MAATVTLTQASVNSGNPITVLCDTVRVAWKNNTIADPNAMNTSVVEVQTQGFDNPVYRLRGLHFYSSGLTYAQLLQLAKLKYTGSNPITMTVTYGITGDKQLVASDGSTTAIKVIITEFEFPINASDSKGGYMPIGSMTLVETA